MFVLDASVKPIEGPENWQAKLDFLQAIVEKLDIGTKAINVGLVTFSVTTRAEFFLYQYVSRDEVNQAISTVTQLSSGTNLSAGLKSMRQTLFRQRSGNRKDSPDIAVIVSDSKPTLPVDNYQMEANLAEESGIHLVAVGITKAVEKSYIDDLSSEPSGSFRVDKHSDLTSIVDDVIRVIRGFTTEVCPSEASKGIPTILFPTGSNSIVNY